MPKAELNAQGELGRYHTVEKQHKKHIYTLQKILKHLPQGRGFVLLLDDVFNTSC